MSISAETIKNLRLMVAARDAMAYQNGCNSSGIARSMIQAIDAIRETGVGTAEINRHPVVYLYLYKLMALSGHEPLGRAVDWAEEQCRYLVAAIEVNSAELPKLATFEEWRKTNG